MNFSEFNLNDSLLKGLEKAEYTQCTQVQEEVLKISQDGSDLYVQSQTGTGKTAAYLVAIIQEMLTKNNGTSLVMVPTRELAVQVEEEAKTLCSASNLKAFSFYGGVGYDKQINALKKGVDIIIGTPGRLIDLQEGGNLDLSKVAYLVLDEADRMFDMGFYPDLRKLLKVLPTSENRQTMLFSATLNSYVKNLAWEYTRDAKEIEIACENITVSEIDQELLHVSSDDKIKLLLGILNKETPQSVIIFCNTKRTCEVIAKRLSLNGIKADFLIGDLPQSRRLKLLKEFKSGNVTTLVATDVAARGIDVDDLAMVINYDLPNEAENYVHRIGRTARAGKSGKAYTFCSEQDVYSLPAIERYIEMQIPSHVAYPEQMMEDKSAGVYIKTEDWRNDGESSHGGHSKPRSKTYKNHKEGEKASSYKKSDRKSDRKDYKKGPKSDTKKKYDKPFTPKEELDKMGTLSLDERMKLYKEKYSSSSKSYRAGKGEGKSSKANTKYKSNKTNSNYSKNPKAYSKKPSQNKRVTQNKSKVTPKPAKKGFLGFIKSLFSK